MTQKESHWHTGYRCRQYTDWPNKRPKPEVWICGSAKEGASVYWGQDALEKIAKTIDARPDITLAEIVEKLELPVGIETVRRAIQAMGYRRKKKMIHASEQERPRCAGQERTMEWVCEDSPGISSGFPG